jgi:hypothetical protein
VDPDHCSSQPSCIFESIVTLKRTQKHAGIPGDVSCHALPGLESTQADVGFQKQFHFTESLGLRFRAEMFNIFNHPNFGNSDSTLSDSMFGHSKQILASSLGSGGPNGGFNPLYQIGGPRSIQLALKLQF